MSFRTLLYGMIIKSCYKNNVNTIENIIYHFHLLVTQNSDYILCTIYIWSISWNYQRLSYLIKNYIIMMEMR